MFTGAGTLGGVFSTTGPDGRRVRDDAAWEAANQQILSACKEAKLPCGYPSNQNDIESRMKEGLERLHHPGRVHRCRLQSGGAWARGGR